MKTNLITLFVVLIGFICLVWQTWTLPWTPMHIAGVAIVIPSVLLLVVARLQLGRAFSVQARATQLVTAGLYARIRNPIYVFGGLTLAGVCLWVGRPLFLLVFAVLIPMQIGRARKEAQVLRERFGAAYDEYRSKTWF